MSDEFKKILEDIKTDAQEENPEELDYETGVLIYDETDTYISVGVFDDGDEHRFRITDPEAIDLNWLASRIVVTPGAAALHYEIHSDIADCEVNYISTESILNWVFDNIPKECYQTLNRLVLTTDSEEDFNYLYDLKIPEGFSDFNDLLEIHSLPDEHCIGISWADDDVIVIDVGHIIDKTKEMLQNGEIFDYEYNSTIYDGIYMTIAHEIRHLQQNNPYVSDSVRTSFLSDPEIDAEEFARDIRGL